MHMHKAALCLWHVSALLLEQADREWDHHDDQIRLALSVSSES